MLKSTEQEESSHNGGQAWNHIHSKNTEMQQMVFVCLCVSIHSYMYLAIIIEEIDSIWEYCLVWESLDEGYKGVWEKEYDLILS